MNASPEALQPTDNSQIATVSSFTPKDFSRHTRRQFLKTAGTVGAVTLLTSACTPAQQAAVTGAEALARWYVRQHTGSGQPAGADQTAQHPESGGQKYDVVPASDAQTIAEIMAEGAEFSDPAEAAVSGANAAIASLRRYDEQYGLELDLPEGVVSLADREFQAFQLRHTYDPEGLYVSADLMMTVRKNGKSGSAAVALNTEKIAAVTGDPREIAQIAADVTLMTILTVQPEYQRRGEQPFVLKLQGDSGQVQADWTWGIRMGGEENDSQYKWEAVRLAGGIHQLAAQQIIVEESARAGRDPDRMEQTFLQLKKPEQVLYARLYTDHSGVTPIELWKGVNKSERIEDVLDFLVRHHQARYRDKMSEDVSRAGMRMYAVPEFLGSVASDMLKDVWFPQNGNGSVSRSRTAQTPLATAGFSDLFTSEQLIGAAGKSLIDVPRTPLPRQPVS